MLKIEYFSDLKQLQKNIKYIENLNNFKSNFKFKFKLKNVVGLRRRDK